MSAVPEQPEFRLGAKGALITGAAGGIGLATTLRFAAEGARVVAVDRRPYEGPPCKGVTWVEADVTDAADVARAASLADQHCGLDICVANAGINDIGDFVDGSADSWRRVLEVNLLGVMLTLQAAARVMRSQGGGGRLLATASVAAVHGESQAAAYAASKGGVMALIRALAVELAPDRITANCVVPGQVDTELNLNDFAAVTGLSGEDLAKRRADFIAATVPLGRMVEPAEVAGVFAFLASDDAALISGESIRIDGAELATG